MSWPEIDLKYHPVSFLIIESVNISKNSDIEISKQRRIQLESTPAIYWSHVCVCVLLLAVLSSEMYVFSPVAETGPCYRPQGKVMFSQASVILSTIGLMPTGSLLILVGFSVTCYSRYASYLNDAFLC